MSQGPWNMPVFIDPRRREDHLTEHAYCSPIAPEYMPRLSSQVLSSERDIQAAKPNGRRAEYRIKGTRNLLLRVSPTGTRSWSYTYLSPLTCRWRRISLGLHPTTTLDDAKTQAATHMIAVRGGVDPLALPPTTDMTFGELADCYLTEHKRRARPNWTREVDRSSKPTSCPISKLYRPRA